MRISEYRLFEEAFCRAFPFMLNRLADKNWVTVDYFDPKLAGVKTTLEDACWNEFCLALDQLGVTFGEIVTHGK